MEGSRHEKAALVSVAYGIGALTAFIWFGISATSSSTPAFTLPISQSASVVSALPTETASVKSIASYGNGVLEVNAIGGMKVLSFNAETSGFSGEEFAVQGSHYGNLVYSVSPSEEYVFFCESKSAGAQTCSPFVYDVLGDMIYPVQLNGQLVDLIVSKANSAKWSGAGLELDGARSANTLQPWVLTK